MTGFQSFPETKLACKYNKLLYKTHYSEILVEYAQGFDMNTGKLIIHPHATHNSTSDDNSYISVNLLKTQETLMEKKPQDKGSTRLQELSVMINTHSLSILIQCH